MSSQWRKFTNLPLELVKKEECGIWQGTYWQRLQQYPTVFRRILAYKAEILWCIVHQIYPQEPQRLQNFSVRKKIFFFPQIEKTPLN